MKRPDLAIILSSVLWASAMPSPPVAAQEVTISNTAQWNGIDGFSTFGEPADATFGQTFVVPQGVDTLRSFAFFVDDAGLDPVAFQAFVMSWDGSKASGPVLFQSGGLVSSDLGAGVYQRFQIVIPGGLKVTPGAAYVAFFSASNLFNGLTGEAQLGVDSSGTYADGGFVSLNNGGNFSAVTTNNWDATFIGLLDLAFEFVFSNSEAGGVTAPPILVVDADAVASALLSSVPTALAQRELALGASRTALRDFNGRLFRQRAGARHDNSDADEGSEDHTVTVGEGDGDLPEGTKITYTTRPSADQHWRVYTSFDYGSLDLDADRNFLGLRSDTYAGSFGIERSITPHLLLGMGASWIESQSDQSTDIAGVTLAAYASASWGSLHADLLYGATLLEHDIDRSTGLGSTVHAEPGSVTHTVALNTGWHLRMGPWITGPFAGVDYAHMEIDGYMEGGGSRAATQVSGQSISSLISRVGWQAGRRIGRPWGAFTPQLRIGWERENLGADDSLTVSLLQSPYYLVQGSTIRSTGAAFTAVVPGQDRERNHLSVGAGVLVELGPRLHLLLDYEGLFLSDGFAAHFGKLAIGWRF